MVGSHAGACMVCLLWIGPMLGQPTALVTAAGRGDVITVRSLLAGGANPNEADNSGIKGWTSLMAAAKSGSTEVVEALLKARANVNATNEYGATALDIAVVNRGYSSAVAVLIRAAGGSGRTPAEAAPSDRRESPGKAAAAKEAGSWIRVVPAADSTFWSFVPDGAPAGHIVARVAPDRSVPSGWEAFWIVSLRTPKHLRIPLGIIKDAGKAADVPLIAAKLPPGTWSIELSHPPTESVPDHFNLESGRMEFASHEIVSASSVSVSVAAGEVRIVTITYKNTNTELKVDGSNVHRISTWEAPALQSKPGSASDLPRATIKVHPLVAAAHIEDLDEPALVGYLAGDHQAASAAAEVLHAIPRPHLDSIVPELASGSLKPDARLAELLVQAETRSAVPALIAVLADRTASEDRRGAAAWALGRLGDPKAAGPLASALSDTAYVACQAAYALGSIQDPSVVPALTNAIRSSVRFATDSVVVSAEAWPRRFGYSGSGWFQMLPMRALTVRQNAIYSLGQLGDPRAVDVLLPLLDDSRADVRTEAVLALGNYPEPRVIQAFTAHLATRDGVTRWPMVMLLGRIGDGSVVELLDGIAAGDSDKLVRDAAAASVGKINARLHSAPAAKPMPPAAKLKAAGSVIVAGAPSKVEITVAPQVEAAIEKATPAAKFAYYVVKGTEPKAAADLVKRTLFICCNLSLRNVVPIIEGAIPSLNAPQFASAQAYGIARGIMPNPDMKPTDTCALVIDNHLITYEGREVPFTGKDFALCKTATESQIVARAIKDMRAAGNGVLLLSRGSRAPAPDFVEIVFK